MIKTLIFDFGGVIATIDRDRAVAAFARIGLADADARLDKYHQSGIFQELEEGKLDEAGFRAELSRLCGRELTFEEVKSAWLGFFVEVPTAILDYLETLKKRYRILILSNTNTYVMSWACSADFSPSGKSLIRKPAPGSPPSATSSKPTTSAKPDCSPGSPDSTR